MPIYLIYVHLSMRLDSLIPDRLDPRHHFLLCDQMVDPLQQAQQTLHVAAPLVQDLVGPSGFGETDDTRGAIDPGVDRLGRDQLADVTLRLVLVQVEELRQAGHLDAGVVLGDDADVVFDDPFA